MKNLGKEIWYADAERSDSPKKILVYSDQGKLNTDGRKLQFEGEKEEIQIDNIERVYLANQQLNWIPYLILFVGSMFWASVIGYVTIMFWGLVILLPLCIALFWFGFKWVVVEFNNDGKTDRAYFSDGRRHGFKGLLGGNRKLFREVLRSVAFNEQPQ